MLCLAELIICNDSNLKLKGYETKCHNLGNIPYRFLMYQILVNQEKQIRKQVISVGKCLLSVPLLLKMKEWIWSKKRIIYCKFKYS